MVYAVMIAMFSIPAFLGLRAVTEVEPRATKVPSRWWRRSMSAPFQI